VKRVHESPDRPSEGRHQLIRLCQVCIADTGTDGGGVSVVSSGGTPVSVLATDGVSAALEDLQIVLGEGPCVEALLRGRPVLVPDLGDEADDPRHRWPVFASEATKYGAGAVFAFPIRIGGLSLGTVDLYRRRSGPLTPEQLASGLRSVEDLAEQVLDLPEPELPGAPSYPLTVHQAAGMVMVQLGATIDQAMARLRACAFVEGVPMSELASSVLDGRRRFTKEER
jgi:hypothetical protein